MYYLAIDIGASSGRHIIGYYRDGKINIEEIHRFENKLTEKDGHLCWDTKRLFSEIVLGIQKCKQIGKVPKTLGIDCFGVDFVLLDNNNNVLGNTVAYRDSRTQGIDKEVYKLISDDRLYVTTGIANQIFNTIYQLFALKKENENLIKEADRFLLLAEYFTYRLTGKKFNEYTNATTTQMVNAKTKQFDDKIIENEVGFNADVVFPPTHDTASAIVAIPTTEDCIYISSGTWSLMGTLLDEPNCSFEGKNYGFTNEGSYDGKIRYLKNIMGLWIIQSIKKELNDEYSFSQLSEMAEKSEYSHKIDVDDMTFFAPSSMIDAIKEHLKSNGYPEPQNIGDILRSVYYGLAANYAQTVIDLERITNKSYSSINIIGGGCRDNYLNKLTAQYTGKTVFAGPVEATAIGNIVTQMIADNRFHNAEEAKQTIANSFGIKKVLI
jgi:rhamnulokinase